MIRSVLPFLPILLLASFTSCDYVSDPIPPDGGGPDPGEGVLRRVLLEDFTGHRCNNCPAAAQTAFQLQAIYGEENLVVVGVHSTSAFAAPADPPNSNGSYSTDFRTPAGNDYTTTFGVSFLPAGMVSRKPFNNSTTLSQSAWGSAVDAIIGEPASMDIWFEDFDYNAGTNTVTTNVKVAIVDDVVGDHNLIVYLTEDHVIDWQLNSQANPPDVPDYEHRHVLRDNLNGTWGGALIVSSASVGDTLTVPVSKVLAATVLDAGNCALVAYAYNTGTNEVMQVRERKFQP
jgi:hypothetical protein